MPFSQTYINCLRYIYPPTGHLRGKASYIPQLWFKSSATVGVRLGRIQPACTCCSFPPVLNKFMALLIAFVSPPQKSEAWRYPSMLLCGSKPLEYLLSGIFDDPAVHPPVCLYFIMPLLIDASTRHLAIPPCKVKHCTKTTVHITVCDAATIVLRDADPLQMF